MPATKDRSKKVHAATSGIPVRSRCTACGIVVSGYVFRRISTGYISGCMTCGHILLMVPPAAARDLKPEEVAALESTDFFNRLREYQAAVVEKYWG